MCQETIAGIIRVRLVNRWNHCRMAGSLWQACPLCSLNRSSERSRAKYSQYKRSNICQSCIARNALGHEGMSRESLKSKVRQEFKTTKRRKKPQPAPSISQSPQMTLQRCCQAPLTFAPSACLHHSGRHCSSHETFQRMGNSNKK